MTKQHVMATIGFERTVVRAEAVPRVPQIVQLADRGDEPSSPRGGRSLSSLNSVKETFEFTYVECGAC